MKKAFTIVVLILFGFSLGVLIRNYQLSRHFKRVENTPTIMKIEITKDFINVREQPSTKAKQIFKVLEGETYEVIETMSEETGVYDWYKIIFSDRRTGWLASYQFEPWVKEK